jgi:sulfate adenylyltransferase subunit 2
MLYSIGRDSAVMLHLTMKAFYPGKPLFPLMHVDTTWKLREMIEFRDRMIKKLGLDLIVYINQDGVDQGIGPRGGASGQRQIMHHRRRQD